MTKTNIGSGVSVVNADLDVLKPCPMLDCKSNHSAGRVIVGYGWGTKKIIHVCHECFSAYCTDEGIIHTSHKLRTPE